MKGILLVNMGGPVSEKGMRFFLKNMFCDDAILPFAKPFRIILSWIISTFRYKKSWSKYLDIGGTPIVDDTKDLTNIVGVEMGEGYKVSYAFSYSNPLIENVLSEFSKEGIEDITIVPLYPHYSLSTWQSVVNHSRKSVVEGNLSFVKPFFRNNKYIEFISDAIKTSIDDNKLTNPLLLFSAHSIPNSLIEKGDYYESEIVESSKLISSNLNLDHAVSYQSQIGDKWLGPITDDVISEYNDTDIKEILIVPISFVGENLETLYDIDFKMLKDFKKYKELRVERMKFNKDQTLLAKAIVEEIKNIK